MTRYDTHAETVTARLVEMITKNEQGEWVMPWHQTGAADLFCARNAVTGSGYRGANVMSLAVAGIDAGYPTGVWATYRQWDSVGAQVRKGERGTQIVKWVTKKLDDNNDTGQEETRLVPRVYAVFNAHQVNQPDTDDTAPIAPVVLPVVGEWIASIGADVVYGGNRASYNPRTDRINIPAAAQFTDTESFYATLIHEHIHWTAHPNRCDRDLTGGFGSAAYAREELVAELGAAIACAQHQITPEPLPDHGAYIAHWLDILGEDPKALFRSASAAQKALDHLNECSNPVPQ